MSDLMFYGVLEMPYDMAMSDEISRLQFYQRVQQAVVRLKAAEAAPNWQWLAIAARAAQLEASLHAMVADAATFPAHLQNAAVLEAARAALAAPQVAMADPLDMPLPCDITVGSATIRQGCKLRTLVAKMQVLHDMAMESPLALRAVQFELIAAGTADVQVREKADHSASQDGACSICRGTRVTFGKRCECAGAAAGGPP